ncbi:MAG TPA: hypothetical protein PKC21_09115 [Oligoflexia bacterium]|nr:hypothetical protein [Oligoflexia bacterium]HMR25497.1 hypothetical protein [Oligoflexia bacterium]
MKKSENIGTQSYAHEASVLGKAFWSIVKLYNLNREEQALILGVKKNGQRLLDLEKKNSIPEDVDKFSRVGILIGIHKNLRMLYPYNRELVYGFIKQPWSLLNKKSPIDFLKEDPKASFQRLFTLRRMLDNLRVAY